MLLADRRFKTHFLILGLIILIAGAIRIYRINAVGFWFDEAVSVTLACGHWKNVFYPQLGYFIHPPDLASLTSLRPLHELFLEGDSHPPLYAFCLRAWWALFGMDDVSCRMFSTVASLIAIIVVFDLARLIAGPTAGLWAAAMMAVSPTQLRYAQEVRSYAMLVLLSAAACDAVLRIHLLGPSRRRWIAATVLIVLTANTHYFIVGAVMGIGLFAWLRLGGRARMILIGIVVLSLTLLLSTRLPVVMHHMDATRTSVHYLDEDRAGLVGRTIGRAAVVPIWLIVAARDDAMNYGAPAVLLLILPFFLDRLRPGLILCALWSLGAIGLVAILDIVLGHNALLYIRYTIGATPTIIVALTVIADIGGKWVRHLLPMAAVIGASLGIPNVYQEEFWQKTESKLWAGDISSHVKPGDVLVVYSRANMGLYSAGDEYLYVAHYAWPLPCPTAVLEGSVTDAVREAIWAHRRVWVASCYYSSIGNAIGPCHVVEEGKVRYGAGKVVRVERDTPATLPSASRHST